MNRYLFPFQKEGAMWLKDHFRCLLADEPGLGKTIQAIELLNLCPGIETVLIVCPASLKLNWAKEIERWSVVPRFPQILSGRTPTRISPDIVIINYDILVDHAPGLGRIKWDLVIADEAHALKNFTCKRSKSFFRYLISGNRVLFMTGTPVLNRPVELWPLLYAIDKSIPGDYKTYTTKFCGGHEEFMRGWVADGATNLSELNDLLKPVMLRRLKHDVLKELPPKTREVIILGEGTGLKDDWRYRLRNLSSFELEVAMSTQRMEDGIMKIPHVISHVRGLLEMGHKIILFAWHKEVVRQLRAALDPDCPLIVGDTSPKARQAAVEKFQNDETCRLIIGNIQSMGVGLTLTASSLVVFAELDWVPNSLMQAEDRAHRIGQKDNVHIQYLVMDGTIDGLMGPAIVEKLESIDHAIDGISSAFDWKQILFEKLS